MEQLEAIKKILPLLVADEAVKAVFLKGSIARGENDKFSDIDLYCLIEREELPKEITNKVNKLFLNTMINKIEKLK